tara:strand:- start:345 stop:686 length:342 start_codon:yes stop_codon:yes gene_type:complete
MCSLEIGEAMIIAGSMNHTPSGRRKKRIVTKKKNPEFVPLRPKPYQLSEFKQSQWQKDYQARPYVRGHINSQGIDPAWEAEKKRISNKYTVAPAYNKGAYQVIPSDSIDQIGK